LKESIVANPGHINMLKQGSEIWNRWREQNNSIQPDLSGADLMGWPLALANLTGANLTGAKLIKAKLIRAKLTRGNLTGANLTGADLTGANLNEAILKKAKLSRVYLTGGATLAGANFTGANLVGAKLIGAYLRKTNFTGADLTGANLTETDLMGANFTGANLNSAHIISADLKSANLKNAYVANIKWTSDTMRGKYQGIRGLDSCHGNAVFKRAALDQDYLDSLEHQWAGTWRTYLFWAWGGLDYGRSLSRVFGIAFVLIVLFGLIYRIWPELIGLDCTPNNMPCEQGQKIPHSWFTPIYFSIVTYTTLGFGDIAPQTLLGEIIVSSEVIIGYLTLGLLLSVLAEKVARRS